jgi:hypothetical protein
MKTQEELLSEEVRAAADVSSRMVQWGVTLMVSLQAAIFFVRQDILRQYIDAGKLSKGAELPPERYLLGTAFLFVMAVILSKLTARCADQYRNYKTQLISCRGSGVKDLPIKHTGRWAYALYFVFPAIDILTRIYIHFEIRF